MSSGVSNGRLTRQITEMYQFNNYQYSVALVRVRIIGLLLSDA